MLGVTLAHLVLLQRWAALDAAAREHLALPPRIEVAFVRVLQPEAAPAPPVARAAPSPPPARRGPRAAEPAPAASEPAPEPEPEPAPPAAEEPAASAPEPAPSVPVAQAQAEQALLPQPSEAVASAPVAEGPQAAASAAAAAFEWPRSTRLNYRLTGYYRGPVDGQAQVEWLREDRRYQVHLEVSIGPSFAPLITRRMSSDGEIGPDGLSPRRYDEETRVVLREPRRVTILFEDTVVRLAAGREAARPPGVQDAASQFVQMTWMFTIRPDLLRPGGAVELPLALPRQVDRWTYDVIGNDTLYTPFGPIEAVHVKPRRAPRPGGDLTAETWFAPSLHHLPVRIVIRQDAETHIDLLLDRLPLQAADGAAR